MKNKNLLMTGSGVCLLFTLFFGCGERTGEKEYGKALASWKSGELSRAQGQMEKAIRKLSDKEKKAVANNQLGIILWNLGKQDQAVEKFSESCSLTEELTGANLNLGLALYHTGDLDQAELQLTNILGEQPRNATANTLNGLVSMKRRNWKQATTQISAGLKTNPSDPAAHNALALAQLHADAGSDKAIERLKQVVAAYPDYAPAAYNLAVIYDQWLHESKRARGWYMKYLELAGKEAPKADAARQAIARLEIQAAGNRDATTSAGNSGSAGMTGPAEAERLIAEGSNLHSAEKYTEAVARYKQAIKLDPSSKTAYYYMGLSQYKLKNYPEAIKAYTEALEIDPRDSNARYMLVLAYCQQKKWSDAEREAKTLKTFDAEKGESMLKYISEARR